MNEILRIITGGNPVTKKNSQRLVKIKGKNGKTFTKILPSKQYEEYEKKFVKSMDRLKTGIIDYPVNLCCHYYMQTKRRVDLVNLLEATCDVLVKAKIIEDDNSNIVVSTDGSRVFYDKDNPRAEITITPIPEGEFEKVGKDR